MFFDSYHVCFCVYSEYYRFIVQLMQPFIPIQNILNKQNLLVNAGTPNLQLFTKWTTSSQNLPMLCQIKSHSTIYGHSKPVLSRPYRSVVRVSKSIVPRRWWPPSLPVQESEQLLFAPFPPNSVISVRFSCG